MASGNSDGDGAASSASTLSSTFDHAFRLHADIMESAEDWRGERFQAKVRRCVLMLEDATRLVSLADVFSRNENVAEVPTEHVRFFLLPALLAGANGKLYDEIGGANRAETIAVQEAYLRDFLQRCNDYEICDVVVPKADEEDADDDGAAAAARPTGRPDLAKMNREREEKIRRYKEQKLLEERVKELRAAVLASPPAAAADEDAVREFYLKTISLFVNQSLDDLASFAMEKPILRHMKNMAHTRGAVVPSEQKRSRPLKPIVITRDKLQKEVFGMGYKNLPVMSIEEFYEQRVRDGWFPAPGKAPPPGKSLQDMSGSDQRAAEEAEAAEKEEKEERDDEEELARKRAWDEYTDEHRRGEGNMHNKG